MIALVLLTMAALAGPTEDWSAERRQQDVAVSRGMMSTRAETVGEGRLVINDHDLVVLGATYGLSDDLQVSVAGLLPVLKDSPRVAIVQGKMVVWRRADTTGALRAVGGVVHQPTTEHTVATLGAGVLVDWLPTEEHWLSLHGAVSLGTGVGQPVSEVVDLSEGTALLAEVGAQLRLHPRLSVMAELWLPTVYDVESGEIDSVPFALMPYGLRLRGRQLSVDAGFIKGLGEIDIDPFILGFPHLAVSVGL